MDKLKLKYIGYLLKLIFFLVVFIISLILNNRIEVFSTVFGSLFGLKQIGIIMFYSSLIITIIYYIYMNFRILYYKEKNIEDSLFIKIDKALDIPMFIFKSMAIIFFIMIFITTPCTVVGESMSPTFSSGEKVLSYNIIINPKRGNIVVFDSSKYNSDESFYIKRVVAIEGDVITYDMATAKFYVNDNLEVGVSVSDFRTMKESTGNYDDVYSFVVPKNKLLLFGDNRGNSLDSRVLGVIDKSSIFGIVYYKLIPFGSIKE